MMAKKFDLPSGEVKGVHVVKEPIDDHMKQMYGQEFYAILYYSPLSNECVLVLPNGLTEGYWHYIIDTGIASLVAARDART